MNGLKWIGAVAAFSGAITVAIGAFGAHGLPKYLEQQPLDEPTIQRRVENLNVGVRYQMYHTLALLTLVALASATPLGTPAATCGLWLAGMVLFSGSLYVYAATGNRLIVRIVPLGGTAYILGWITLLVKFLRR